MPDRQSVWTIVPNGWEDQVTEKRVKVEPLMGTTLQATVVEIVPVDIYARPKRPSLLPSHSRLQK